MTMMEVMASTVIMTACITRTRHESRVEDAHEHVWMNETTNADMVGCGGGEDDGRRVCLN